MVFGCGLGLSGLTYEAAYRARSLPADRVVSMTRHNSQWYSMTCHDRSRQIRTRAYIKPKTLVLPRRGCALSIGRSLGRTECGECMDRYPRRCVWRPSAVRGILCIWAFPSAPFSCDKEV